MFDFHMHSTVSYDGKNTALEMLRAAESKGLKEICFTDHLDYVPAMPWEDMAFSTDAYNKAYDELHSDKVLIRRGCEFGMLSDNADTFRKDMHRRHFDFVIGSAHCVDGMDIWFPDFWQNKTVKEAEEKYFREILSCVHAHDGFDVLGHLTYICKLKHHIPRGHIPYEAYSTLVDEIFCLLIEKGKGIEVNTSGVDACGSFLPDAEYLRRFRQMGGKIVTVGSDAHDTQRVGQYTHEACRMVMDIFGYVCTFQNREPIFHRP